jgi:acyl-CoA synthetase (AMP-forming)/AMP-acid ligase II
MRPTSSLVIGDVFTNAARAVPDRAAAALGDSTVTFADLDSQSNRLARALAWRGVDHGSRVVLWSGTDLRATLVFAALAKLGALFLPINGALGPEEAAGIMEVARPDLVLTDVERPAVAAVSGGTMTLGQLDALADPLPDGAVSTGVAEGESHVAFFTSGTTGRPKGAVLSHRTSYLRTHPGALPEPRGAMVCPYPLFHMGAWTIALQQWQGRHTVVLVESATAEEICQAVERHRATRLNCIPAVWRRILDLTAGVGSPSLASLRFADTGTSATPLELLTAIEGLLPAVHLRVFYGSTEAGSVSCLDHADIRRKPGSCGPPAPGVTVRLSDSGELWVRSATLFDGYLDDPEATAACLIDGWYRTGDLVEEDGDGFLSVVGRAGDLVRTGGETVVPSEVEAVLAEHGAVAEVAVVGLPDPTWGEVVCAVVVVRPDREPPTLEGLHDHCRGRLAPFKQPRRLRVVGSLPRTASTGQVQRRLLVEQLAGR